MKVHSHHSDAILFAGFRGIHQAQLHAIDGGTERTSFPKSASRELKSFAWDAA